LQFIEKGVTDEMLEKLLLPRHALHAESVFFRHPQTQERYAFHAPVPDDLRTFIQEHA
jgi:23S rRNA-/tRNA-specific pseudouridylate synthase